MDKQSLQAHQIATLRQDDSIGTDSSFSWAGVPHLAGPAAAVRPFLTAYFLRDCPHIIEIGGGRQPVTDYLTHRPLSVLSVDPKIVPRAGASLRGHPCRVLHVAEKFQNVRFDTQPWGYGLALIGLSLKPSGRYEALDPRLLRLVDEAKVAVIEYTPALRRAAWQVSELVNRPDHVVQCSITFDLEDEHIAMSAFGRCRLVVLRSRHLGIE